MTNKEQEQGHDNINVKVTSRVTIYGNIVLVGSASVVLVGFVFLAIFLYAYWTQAVTLATIVVYGLVVAFFVAIAALLRGLWLKVATHPSITAQERKEALRGQQMKNRVLHWQENAIVAEVVEGTLTVVPLYPQAQMIAGPEEEEESDINEELVCHFYDQPSTPTLHDVAKALNTTYSNVQTITARAKKNGRVWKNR